MGVKFTNNAFTTLSSSINAGATSFSVASVSTFPSLGSGDYMYVSLTDEVVKVTAVSGTTLTCVATSGAHSAGIAVELRMTAELLNDFAEDAEALPLAGGAMTGAITTNSTFDGRDVATDGTKLDGIEASATADQTAAQIKTLLENGIDSVHYVDGSIDAEHIAADAVTEAKLNLISTGSVPSLEAKGDGSSQDGYIQLNCSQNSHGIKLKSPPHSANASYTLTFPNNDGSANEYLQTNGSGVLTWNAVDLTALSATNLTSGTVPAARITAASIANDLIDSQHYAAASIDNEHLADNAVDTAEIAASAVETAKINDGAVTTAKLAADSVTTAKIADNVTLGGNVTVSGNLTVSGTETTVNTATLAVEDPLVSLATGNNGSDAIDIGVYGLYDTSGSQDLYSGLFRDASDSGKWKLFKDNQAAPTTTVNTSGTGYAVGTLVANLEGAVTGDLTGQAATATKLHTARAFTTSGDVVVTSTNFDGSANFTAAATIQTGAVEHAMLAADAVDGDNLADNACDSEHYTDGSIDTAHLGDLQVTGAKLALDRRSAASTNDVKMGNQHDYIFADADVGLSFFTANAEDMRLTDAGDLHVDGDVIAFSSTISDETLKYDINPIDHALDKVAQLTGVTYKYLKDGMESAGLLAQDVEKVMPCAVSERKLPMHKNDGKSYKTLNYDNLHALLIESIKELTAKVEKLEKK